MFVSKLIKFKWNLNVLFRERLKIQRGPKLFSAISRSGVYEMIHLNAFKCQERSCSFSLKKVNAFEMHLEHKLQSKFKINSF